MIAGAKKNSFDVLYLKNIYLRVVEVEITQAKSLYPAYNLVLTKGINLSYDGG